MRLTTGVGIAVGGVGGALAALLGAPAKPAPSQPPPVAAADATAAGPPAAEPSSAAESPSAAGELGQPLVSSSASPTTADSAAPAAEASAAPALKPAPPAAAVSALAPPPLDLPTTREALLKAELYCDQKRLYDECSRAALALEQGTSGPPDLAQAKRFRKIALTHLVRECEVGDPHACFIMAAKYRAGNELAPSPARADVLEQRGLSLCRLRSAPECPTP